MKDAIWVFRNFGFKIGMQFIFDTLSIKAHRLWNGQYVPTFQDLTDEEVQELKEVYDPEIKIVHSYEDTVN
jgi:hypothetical protein